MFRALSRRGYSPIGVKSLPAPIVNAIRLSLGGSGSLSSAMLATLLDQEMLEVVRAIPIASRTTPMAALQKTGAQVANELGGRYLLRYLLREQVGSYAAGSNDRHWVTPTPYAPGDTIPWLALPAPTRPRTHVMLLDPSKIATICGPRWVRFGKGIEYHLPSGFPPTALALAWELQIS
jgi:hypothetical protein